MQVLNSHPKNWNHLDNPDLGFMKGFSEFIVQIENEATGLLPDIRQGSTIFVGSDYSGQHNIAQYESYTLLLADLERCGNWETKRQQVRQRFLADGRRMSYKDLRDQLRKRALIPFLIAADSIPGLLVTVLVNKQIDSLFEREGRLNMSKPDLKEYEHWDRAVFEKLLRVLHFVSFFVAGLSRSDQNVLWITDEDEIVANSAKLQEVCNIFLGLCSHYLKHNLRHARIGTTKSDTGIRDVEDLVAVADLAAGALCQLLTEYQTLEWDLSSGLIVPPPKRLPSKAKLIMDWVAESNHPLKRLVFIIDEIEQGGLRLKLRRMKFHAIPSSAG
jgi:hypothetical protein